jgi:hypothetical protein
VTLTAYGPARDKRLSLVAGINRHLVKPAKRQDRSHSYPGAAENNTN